MALIDKFSKEELQAIVAESTNLKEVIVKLGYTPCGNNHITVKDRLQKYNIDTSHFTSATSLTKRNEENIFIINSTASQAVLRRWYKKGDYAPYKCSICNLGPEWQNKPLTLILDHINGTHNDNRLENLRWVCPNCNQQLETTGFHKMRVTNQEEKVNHCLDCGAVISLQYQYCHTCAMKHRRKTERPTREELKLLIRTQTFTQLSKDFGVSDKAIVKWCINYNLPSRKKDINQYSDIEWEKI